jgi:hypothetical protein
VKDRHQILELGLVGNGAQTGEKDMRNFTKGILFVNAAGATTVVLEATPDGTNWFPTGVSVTAAGVDQLMATINVMPGRVRVNNTGASAALCHIEGVREVA